MKRFINVPSPYILFSLFAITLTACAVNKSQLLSFEYLPAVFEHEYSENEAKVYLVNDQNSYNALLTKLKMKQQDRTAYAEYWENNSLLLVYGGTRPSSGYYIQTDSLLQKGKTLEVIATLTGPGENCMVAEMITYPMQLLAIPKTKVKGDIKLHLKPVSKACR